MLIRSQNKRQIIALENAISINADDDNDIVVLYPMEGAWDTIGEYSSREKAEKALDMIQDAYQYTEECKYFGIGCTQPEFVFDMPKDGEI